MTLQRLCAGEDIIDEALRYFRANVLFRKYDVKGAFCGLCFLSSKAASRHHLLLPHCNSARYIHVRWSVAHSSYPDMRLPLCCSLPGPSDKLLIYLTLYINSCLRKLENCPTQAAGQKARPCRCGEVATFRIPDSSCADPSPGRSSVTWHSTDKMDSRLLRAVPAHRLSSSLRFKTLRCLATAAFRSGGSSRRR